MKTKLLSLSAILSLFALVVFAPRVFAVTTEYFSTSTTEGVWNSSGNVGIRTTSPAFTLDVNGFSRFASGVRIQPTTSSGNTWYYYPNVTSYTGNNTISGAIVINTNISRTANEMFKIRVNGYGYAAKSNIDFTVVGYAYSGVNGNVDGLSGAIVNYSINDNGNDGLPKWVGINSSGNVAVVVGNYNSSFYYYRVSADYWSTLQGIDASSGWSINTNTTSGFGFDDLHQLTASLTQTTNGYVGIEQTTPAYNLDVVGNGNFTGVVNVGTPTAAANAATKSYVDSAIANVTSTLNGSVNGTTNYVPVFTGTNAIGNSVVYQSGSNIGIGTTSPGARLDVWKNGSADLFNLSSSTAGDILTVLPSGNVGVGTTGPAYKLDVNGAGSFEGYVIHNIGTPVATTDAANKSYVDSAIANVTSTLNGDVNGTTNYLSYFTGTNTVGNSVVYQSGGNIGIGTTTPAYPLDVNGNARATGFIANRMGLYGTYNSSQVQGIWTIGTSFPINTASDTFGNVYGLGYSYQPGSGQGISGFGHQIDFLNNGSVSAAVSLTSGGAYFAGNVGVGTTTPAYPLDVNGAGSFEGYVIHNIGTPTTGSDAANKSYVDSVVASGTSGSVNGTTNYVPVFTGTNAIGNSVVYQSGSNVGVGTTTPAYPLDVNGAGSFEGYVIHNIGTPVATTDAANKSYVDSAIANVTSTLNGDVNGTTNYLSYFTGTNTVGNSVVYQSGSNVGIGTTGPNYPLDVSGSAHVSGNLGVGQGPGALTGIGQTLSNSLTASQGMQGLQFNDTDISSVSNTHYVVGVQGNVYSNLSAGVTNSGYIQGLQLNALARSASTLTSIVGSNIAVGNYGAGGADPNATTANVTGYTVSILNLPNSTISNAIGYNVTLPSAGTLGTVTGFNVNANSAAATNKYGLYLGAISGGTSNNYSIYSNGGNNYFAGNVGIGKTPAYTLDVNGTGNFTGVVNVGTPTAAQNAATKSYVDTAVASGVNGGISGTTNYLPVFTGTNTIRNSAIYQSGSNVGIGTTTPAYPLDVNGNARATGFISNGGLTFTNWGNTITMPSGNTTGYLTFQYGSGNNSDNVSLADNFRRTSDTTGTIFNTQMSSEEIDVVSGYSSGSETGHIGFLTAPYNGVLPVERMRITNSGNVGIGTTGPTAKLQVAGNTWIIGSASIGQNINGTAVIDAYNGDAYFGDNSATNGIAVASNGYVGIATTTPGYTLTVAGTGYFGSKLTANTIDPLYTINGTNYATYVPGMTGEKEETAGTLDLQRGADGTYAATMDFAPAAKGSDLWLFAQATNLANTMDKMIVTLTPSFEGNVWYTKDAAADTLTIHGAPSSSPAPAGSAPTNLEVSYNLTAPRFDAAQWPNLAPADESSTQGLIINNP